ncbi:hypothetical protein Nepgr_019887 [Nepenthes gracilis]|uniref:rRNA methyltransferase 1, mitochondrial n=1 Tax=Nepenthes gracilis TaxID=150966 RepID=A0AAD3XVT2_NEPGR|nr:hypothetical protein Nepgr_019887 [Nepenthes gracilis]
MYSNLSKSQALPAALRVSSPHKCFKPLQTSNLESLSLAIYSIPTQNPSCVSFANSSCGFPCKTHKNIQLLNPTKILVSFHNKATRKQSSMEKHRSIFDGHSVGIALRNSQLRRLGNLSNSYSSNAAGGNGGAIGSETLPWLADDMINESKRLEKVINTKISRSSWEVSAKKYIQRKDASLVHDERSRNIKQDKVENTEENCVEQVENHVDDSDNDNGCEIGVVDDSRWDKIKNRLGGVVSEKPKVRKWSKLENWGRKTWRETTESSVPKMVGEGVYGVGPVLAALSARRREFYVLFVQEGLDLSRNNRKRKDKKGFEEVLRIADKIGLTIKEVSKHDLNMIVDNRPHQGIVLDASPLEMMSIKELDAISAEGDKGLLWVALDEVTDPQNLGAIIRSSYFFGTSGVVLCAKNSAPLSAIVSKASAGSLELMEIRSCKNMMQFLVSSAENGWRVLGGSVSSRAVPLHKVSPGVPTILVLGSEGTGLRPLVERSCTHLVRIEGNIPVDISAARLEDEEDVSVDHKCSGEEFRSFLAVESLNVSVAAGVLLHHLIGSNFDNNCRRGDKDTGIFNEA